MTGIPYSGAGVGFFDVTPGSAGVYGYASQTKPQTWLDQVHPYYGRLIPEWRYARDHYGAEVLRPHKVSQYLIRKQLGETYEAYEERVRLADYTPHFGAVVDALAGMLAQVEHDATRVFGAALGDAHDPSTPIGRLWMDADKAGNGWLSLWQILATDLITVHDGWIMVDGGPDGTRPRARIVEAENVVNWREEDGVLVEALVAEPATDVRSSLEDLAAESSNPAEEKQWLKLDVSGWARWRKAAGKEQGKPVPELVGGGAWRYVTRDGAPTIPLVRVQLPLRRNVGYSLARKANAIFNKESERDHLLRYASFPLLNVSANDAEFKKIKDGLREGARVLQVKPGAAPHGFAAPDTGGTAMMEQAIRSKVDDFYVTAFSEYGSSSKAGRDRVTATEVKSDVATGVAAFLGIVRLGVDNAENQALFLLEQTLWPDDGAKWENATVSRSSDFAPFDVNGTIERLRTRYFGQQAVVPVGKKALVAAAAQIAQWDGLEADQAEIEEQIDEMLAPPQPPAQSITQQIGAAPGAGGKPFGGKGGAQQ